MDYHQILSDILKAAIVAAMPYLLSCISSALSWLKAWLEARTKNEWLLIFEHEVFEVVSAVQQKVVQPIKDAAADGKLSDEEKARIKQIAMDELNARLKDIPKHLFPDLLGRIGHAVEAAVPQAKALQNPPKSPESK